MCEKRFADRCDIQLNALQNFIQTWRQQHGRSAFFHSAYSVFNCPICFRSVWCRNAMILGKLCRIPRNCQCKWLLASSRVPRTFVSFSRFLVKSCFCTDTPGSIEWVDPAPRLHIGDCYEISNCHWGLCNLLFSSHQNLQLEVRLRHCVLCTRFLYFWSSHRSRNFGL